MKLLLLLMAPQILGPILFHKPSAANYYCRSITIDAVGSTLTNYPVMISGTYSYLAYEGSGGKVKNSSGYDVRFYPSSDCSGTKLDHETELYTAATGQVLYWIKKTLSTSTTVISVRYGESGISTDQSNATGTWNSDFKGVWHLSQNTTNYLDSTSNARHWTSGTNPTRITGQLYYGQQFDGSTITLHPGSNWVQKPTVFTVSHWIRLAANQTGKTIFGNYEPVAGWVTGISDGTTNKIKFFLGAGTVESATALSNSTWYLVTCVYDSGSAAIYINGTSDATGIVTIYYPGGAMSENNRLGSLNSSAQFFNGDIDEVRYSTVAQSSHWIAAEYANQSDPANFYTIGSEVAH